MSIIDSVRAKPKLWVSASLLTAGLASGVYLGGTLTSGAATPSSTTGVSSAATGSTATGNTATGSTAGNMPAPPGSGAGTGSTGSTSGPPAGAPKGAPTLPKSGTVTAVGSNSVTIDGTTYAVTSSSDIDKNGEATLSDLVVGDTVTFSTVSSASTPTIDKLHAGNEALDRPTGPPSSSSGQLPPAGHAPSGQAPASGQSSSAAA